MVKSSQDALVDPESEVGLNLLLMQECGMQLAVGEVIM